MSRPILVTGAASGLGLELSHELLARGRSCLRPACGATSTAGPNRVPRGREAGEGAPC